MTCSMALTLIAMTTVIAIVTANTLRPTVQSNDDNGDYGDYGNQRLLVHMIDQIRDDLQEEREARIRETVELSIKVRDLESTVTELMTQNNELMTKNTELEPRIDQLTSDYNDNARLQMETMEKLKEEFHNKTEELESGLMDSIAHVTTKNEELTRNNTELESHINQLTSDYNKSTRQQFEIMDKIKEELHNKINELESRLNTCKNTDRVEEILLQMVGVLHNKTNELDPHMIDILKDHVQAEQVIKNHEFESTITQLTTKTQEFESTLAQMMTMNQQLVRNNSDLEEQLNTSK